MLRHMRGDFLMRLGVALTIFGMLCTVLALLPLFNSNFHARSYLWPLAMTSGLGLALILFGLRRSSGSRKRLK
jgi:hypothetical protein